MLIGGLCLGGSVEPLWNSRPSEVISAKAEILARTHSCGKLKVYVKLDKGVPLKENTEADSKQLLGATLRHQICWGLVSRLFL